MNFQSPKDKQWLFNNTGSRGKRGKGNGALKLEPKKKNTLLMP